MRTWIRIAAPLLLAAVVVAGAPARSDAARKRPSTRPVVEAEQAFCALSVASGTRAAFLGFLADSSIIFRHGPELGRPVFLAGKEQPGRLTWKPRVAGVALSGELGFTTGPWEWRAKPDTAAVAFGTFSTVWAVQAGGGWKALVDIGVDGPNPGVPLDSVALPAERGPAEVRSMGRPEYMRFLAAREAAFTRVCSERGAGAAYAQFLGAQGVLLRDGHLPAGGPAAAAPVLAATPGTWTWRPVRTASSSAGDLGYVYGTYTFKGQGWRPDSVQAGSFMRIWSGGDIALDVAHPEARPR